MSRRILRDLDVAEDATQQALLSIWQDLPQLRDPARIEASTTQHAPALAADVVHLAAVV